MAKHTTVICDICNKRIEESIGLTTDYYEQYKVKIKHVENMWSLAGFDRNIRKLDVCPDCMGKFVEFVRKEQP